MALAANVESAAELGNDWHVYGSLTLDNSYPTGGYDLTGKITGQGATLGRIGYLNANGGGYVYELVDATPQKLLIRRQKDPGAAGGADIVLPEVANATDLSAVVPKFIAIGQ